MEPTPLRTTEFAASLPQGQAEAAPVAGYARSRVALPWKRGRFSERDFVLQPDGTLRYRAGKTLHPTEQRREADGSLRVLYAARIKDCRPCPLREHCLWHGSHTTKPRRVSLLLHRFRSAQLLCSGVIGAVERIGTPACSSCSSNGWT